MPEIHFQCPNCNQSLDAPTELRNELIDCPSCGQVIQVPADGSDAPEQIDVDTSATDEAAQQPADPQKAALPPKKQSKSLYNALFGTASQIDPAQVAEEFKPLLVEGEEIIAAYRIFRDLFVFTQRRLILADKQGLTGKKIDYRSIPYKSISQFSIETAGLFDADSELSIYISGNPVPIKKEFRASEDMLAVQKIIAMHVLR